MLRAVQQRLYFKGAEFWHRTTTTPSPELTTALPLFDRAIARMEALPARMDQREQHLIAIKDRRRRHRTALIDLIGGQDGIPDEPPRRKDTTADAEDNHHRQRAEHQGEQGARPDARPRRESGRGTHRRGEPRRAAEAWDTVATHAATHADQCRHGAELADRTRHRWARAV